MNLPLRAVRPCGPHRSSSLTGKTGEEVLVAHTNALNAYPLTVEVWFITTENTTSRGLVSKYADSSANGWSLHVKDGRLNVWYFKDPTNYVWDGGAGLDAGPIADGK